MVLFAACVPTEEGERVGVEQLSGQISYYPQETGAIWQYLPSEALIDEPRLFSTVEGPTVLDGEVWIAWRSAGRGIDIGLFRQYRDDGVYLRRKEQPGTIFTFDPPIRELPTEGTLRVGANWAGSTEVLAEFPAAPDGAQTTTLMVDYVYTVVDQRTVTLLAGEFEVFVLNFVTRTFDDEGTIIEELTQEIWFAPFVGEVRTDSGYFLVGSNFLEAPAAQGEPAPAP